MRILVAGGSGFIGTSLVFELIKQHQVTVLGRDSKKLSQKFQPPIHVVTWTDLENLDPNQYDIVMNLSGANIGDSKWHESAKKKIIASRVTTTETLVRWILKHQAACRFFCANAIGIYGLQNEHDPEGFTESSALPTPPKDFLSEVGLKWQEATHPAVEAGLSVTTLRFGVVLGREAGMLKKLIPSFSLGLGSLIGSGQQIISWITIDDLVQAILFLIHHPHLTGPFNLTSPSPVTQATFARFLANTLHRPLWFKMPARVVRLLFGEMGDALILKGTRVFPKRLEEAGFKFQYPTLEQALNHIFLK